MLVFSLKLSIYAMASIGFAALLCRKFFFTQIGYRVLFIWLAMIPFVFIVRNQLLILFAAFLLTFYASRKLAPSLAICFAIAVLPAVPDWFKYAISAPGINNITTLYFWKIVYIVVFIPLFLKAFSENKIKTNAADIGFIALVAFFTIMSFRDNNFTSVLRIFFNNMFIYIIPYFAISRSLKSEMDYRHVLLGFLFLSLILASIFLVSQLLKTDFYIEFNPHGGWLNRLIEYRHGLLRLSGPLNGVLVGYLMAAGFLAFFLLNQYTKLSLVYKVLIVAIFTLAIFSGGSRGALFSVLMIFAIYLYFGYLKGITRTAALFVGIFLVIIVQVFDLGALLSYEDEHGTFDYRSELYKTSFAYIQYYPLFGNPGYVDSGFFDHLYTGLGIIDIVSEYLAVMLMFGFVGLVLYCFPFLAIVVPLTKKIIVDKAMPELQMKYSVVFWGLLVGYLFVIATTSTVSLVENYGVIILAICRSLLAANVHSFRVA